MAQVKVLRVEPYELRAKNGRHIRIASKAILEDGSEVKFLEKLTKNEAIVLLTYVTASHRMNQKAYEQGKYHPGFIR